jgi:hypothetical protein
MSLTCLNCKKPVDGKKAKLFAEVFLCVSCHSIAVRLYERGESELRMMLVVLKESVRLAALKGELQFAVHHVDDMSKEDLMSRLARLAAEVRGESLKTRSPEEDKWSHPTSIPSPATTPPSAPSAEPKPSSS